MSKRAAGQFARKDRDFYPTPEKAILPLVWHLRRTKVKTFAEPCMGDGAIIKVLGHRDFSCVACGDVDEQFDTHMVDAREWRQEDLNGADAVVTNTPWEPALMQSIMTHLSGLIPCWFLTYWDWPSTHQSTFLMSQRATDVVPIGRVKWIPDSPSVGFDNACWIRMEPHKDSSGPARLWHMSELR